MRKTPLCCSLLMMFSLSGMTVGCAPEAKPNKSDAAAAKSTDDKKAADSTNGVDAKGTDAKPADAAKPADTAKMPVATKKKPKKAPSDSSTIGGGVENVPAAGGVEEKPETPGTPESPKD